MTMEILLAQVIGAYLVLEGLVLLIRKKFVVNILNDLSSNKALMYVTGAMVFVLGLLIVLNHNVWEATWQVIPTIVGWFMVVVGVAICLTPKVVLGATRSVARNRNVVMLTGIVGLALGAYLLYVGFGMGM